MSGRWIKKLDFTNVGPFVDATLFAEPGYNVITGANNTGKTFALARVAEALQGKKLHPHWESHRKPSILISGKGDEEARVPAVIVHLEGVDAPVQMTGDCANSTFATVKWLAKVPRCGDSFMIDQPDKWGAIGPTLRYWLDLNNVKPLSKFHEINQTSRDNLITGFEEALNGYIKLAFPFFDWPLRIESQGGTKYRIRVVDKHALSEPRDNGDGFHSMLGLVCECLTQPWPDVLLIDEPERSLHPGAQKELRNFLVKLANEPNGPQVIVATHSPYFLDQRRASATSVLRWTTNGVQIINRPSVKGGSQELRDALGIEIADTLAFASDVLLVEGECEHDFLVRLLETYSPEVIGSRVIHPWKMSQQDAGVAAQFLQSHKLNFVVVVDNDKGGKDYVSKVLQALPDAKTFTWKSDFEGLFEETEFIQVAAQMMGRADKEFLEERARFGAQAALSNQLRAWGAELKDGGTIDYVPSKRDFLAAAVRTLTPSEDGRNQLLALAKRLATERS